MNPNCGNTDKIVNTSDNAQIFNDLSAVIFLSVGRILLEKNSLTYIKMLLFFIFTSIKFTISMRLNHIAWSVSLSRRPWQQPTLRLLQYHQRIQP